LQDSNERGATSPPKETIDGSWPELNGSTRRTYPSHSPSLRLRNAALAPSRRRSAFRENLVVQIERLVPFLEPSDLGLSA